MINIRPLTQNDKSEMMSMEYSLNHTDAVDEPAPQSVIECSFQDAISSNPHLDGYIIEQNGNIAGFAYLTYYYSCEVARNVVMIEELFIKEEYRSKGIGKEFFSWLYKKYPKDIRFKLEVTPNNKAARLYKRVGFSFLDHDEMVFDI